MNVIGDFNSALTFSDKKFSYQSTIDIDNEEDWKLAELKFGLLK